MNLRQQDVPAEDLSDLAGPGTRGAGLAGLVGDQAAIPTRKDQAPSAPTTAVDSTGGATIAAVPDIREDAETVRPRTRKPGRPRTRVKPTTAVYVSPGVKQRFEAYRHKRFASRRMRGERFRLSASDVKAFKRWRRLY